jgi:hypothetical protein
VLAEFTGRARQPRDAIAAEVAAWRQSGRMRLLVLTSEFARDKREAQISPPRPLFLDRDGPPEQPHQSSAPLRSVRPARQLYCSIRITRDARPPPRSCGDGLSDSKSTCVIAIAGGKPSTHGPAPHRSAKKILAPDSEA